MAAFKVSGKFYLTDRGDFLIGSIIEGEIDSGYIVQKQFNGEIIEIKIKSIEYVDHQPGVSEIALFLEPYKDESINFNFFNAGEIIVIKK